MVSTAKMLQPLIVFFLIVVISANDTSKDTSVEAGDEFVGRMFEQGVCMY